jgi:hypothetical protein
VVIKIKYGDTTYCTEGDYEDVCRQVVDGKPLDVYYVLTDGERISQRIIFFGDPEWVAMDL